MSFLGNLKETVEDGKEIAEETTEFVNEEVKKGREFNSQATGFEPSPLEEGLFGEQEEIKEEEKSDGPSVRINIY